MSAVSSSPPTLLKNILVCYYYRVYVLGARACYRVSVEAGSQLHGVSYLFLLLRGLGDGTQVNKASLQTCEGWKRSRRIPWT